MSKFKNKCFDSLVEYTPGEQPQDKRYIKLNTNESPFAPSESVIKALNSAEVERLCLYSDPECKQLKNAIGAVYGFDSENIFVSNGSDEILNFAFMLYGKQNGAAFADITYGFYKVFADLYGIEADIKPLKADLTVDVEDYIHTGKFTVLANPNAPTGIALPLSEIERIISSNADNVVLIDEAYVDFGGESAVELVRKYDNLIVCQTYSKSRSMAGARLGFCFASAEIIKDLELIKYSTNPYNINRLTQIAGAAAMKENDYYTENCARIIKAREYTVERLEQSGFTVLPSSANFVFARHDKISGEKFYLRLKEKGILVRHFTSARIADYNRITIGSMEQMTAFCDTAELILKET